VGRALRGAGLAGGAAPVIQALPKAMRAKMRALALRTTPQGLTRRQRKNFFLFALYYVRELGASDAWISVFQTTQRISLLLGYILWTRIRETKNSRFILLATTLMMSLYPAMTSRVRSVLVMAVISAVAGFFQAGLKLVFFDELMKTVPVEQSATFVSVEKSVQYLLAIAGPMISTSLSSTIGLSGALLLGAGMRLVGFLSFLFGKEGRSPVTSAIASDVKAEGS